MSAKTMPAPVRTVYGCEVDEEDGSLENLASRWRLEDLPPLPPPKKCDMLLQSTGGTFYVSFQIFCLVGGTHGLALTILPRFLGQMLTADQRFLYLTAIYTEAVIAVVCLLFILCGDPGVIPRTEENCFPLPAEVAEKIRRGESLESMENVDDGDRSFCVRCLVWRPKRQVPMLSSRVASLPRPLQIFFRQLPGCSCLRNAVRRAAVITAGPATAASATSTTTVGSSAAALQGRAAAATCPSFCSSSSCPLWALAPRSPAWLPHCRIASLRATTTAVPGG